MSATRPAHLIFLSTLMIFDGNHKLRGSLLRIFLLSPAISALLVGSDTFSTPAYDVRSIRMNHCAVLDPRFESAASVGPSFNLRCKYYGGFVGSLVVSYSGDRGFHSNHLKLKINLLF
jgi:hypothetical protein